MKIDQKEYEITIQSLSTLDKAKILYNHIWFGELNEEYIDELYSHKRYLQIVVHENYNPRLISFITDSTRISNTPSKDYWKYIQATLKDPKGIWADVYDNQLDDLMRLAVCLVVFNGGEINEGDFQEAFFSQAINGGLASKSNVNNRYIKTIRSAVGAVLERILVGDGEVVRLGLFNPSVADFILGRYADDHMSLEPFFIHLNTVSSIENLENLKKNNMLGDAGYSQILEKLGSDKIGLEHLRKNAVYTLKLTRMAIQQKNKPSPDIFEAIVALVTAINTVPVPVSCIEDACLVLAFVSASKKHMRFQEIATKFIERYLEDYYDHDDLVNLFSLAQNLDTEFQETVLLAIKSNVEEFWKDQIDHYVAEERVLEEYVDPEEEGDAFNEIFEYLSDKLSYFDYAEDEISRIAEFADIQGQIEANQEALMQGEEDYETWRGSGDESPQNDYSLVHDLFQRE